MKPASNSPTEGRTVQITAGDVRLEGNLAIPPGAKGIVVFVHGSGSSRLSPRNRFVAAAMREGGLATLLFDLLTAEEDRVDQFTREWRFNIPHLARRLGLAADWLREQPDARDLEIGYFGSSTGAAAALIASAERPEAVRAVVSRGGRPDLAMPVLEKVRAATLLIVGGNDTEVIALNRLALKHLTCAAQLDIVPGATHLFEEPGTLEEVSRLAREWFVKHLGG